MRVFAFAVLAVWGVLMPLGAIASAEAPVKIGVFSIQDVMKNSKTVKGYFQKLEKELSAKKKQVDEKQAAVKETEEKLKRGAVSAFEKRRLEEKLTSQSKELKRLAEDVEADLKRMDRELTQQALREIDEVVKELASKENYTIIFEKSAAGIIHAVSSIDITQKIISLYDEKKK